MSLQALAQEFQNFASWSELQDQNSNFVQFLRDTCVITDEEVRQQIPVESEGTDFTEFIDLKKLKVLGILLCEGKNEERVFELYDAMQDNFQEKIACNDKDFEPVLYLMFDLATETAFYWEPIYMQNNAACKVDKYDIGNVRNNYKDILDEFVDEVFDTESMLARNEWQSLIVKKQPWILSPAEIRKKLYPNIMGWDDL